jgi:hypothetical protein
MRVIAGRGLADTDTDTSLPVVVINGPSRVVISAA